MKISIITTLYNYREYIGECIESFLNQDFIDSEIVIVDDASTDNPYKVIRNYESDRVRYLRLDKNMGYSHAKNVGIKNSKAEILVMLDADDFLTQNSLTSRYKVLQQGYDLVHGRVWNLHKGKKSPSKMFDKWLASPKDNTCYKLIHAQSVMLRKQIHREIGLYDETMKCKSDREFWARCLNHNYKVGWTNDYVSIYRKHSKQMHQSKEKLKNNDRLEKESLEKMERRKTDLSGLEMLT